MKYLGPKTDAANLAAQGDLPIAVSSTPPAGASEGDLWLDSDTGRLYCYYDAQWINPASVGRSVSTAAATTITGTNSEGTSNSLARADHNHAIDSSLLVPTGAITQYAGTTAPTGWLLCDGTEKAVATYPTLDSVLGTTYGSRTNGSGGAGSSHFRLPDLQGRIPVGKGSHADVSTLGNSDGSSLSNRRPKHQHTVYDPGHFHTTSSPVNIAGSGALQGAQVVATGGTSTNTTGIKVNPENASTSSSPTDAPAYLVVNYIIRAT